MSEDRNKHSGQESAPKTGAQAPAADNVGTNEKRKPSNYRYLIAGAIFIVVILIVIGAFNRTVPAGPARPASIAVVSEETFAEDGTFELSGLSGHTAKQVEEGLSFEPSINFSVKQKTKDIFAVTLKEYRDIAYKGVFTVTGEEGQTRERYRFDINAPALTASITSGSTISSYRGTLTLAFSEQVDGYSLKQNLRIVPPIPYSLSYDLEKALITPETAWLPGQTYTVCINAEYKSKTGKEFTNDQEFYFNTSDWDSIGKTVDEKTPHEKTPYINFPGSNSFISDLQSPLSLQFQAGNLKADVPVLIHTYRLPTVEKQKDQGAVFLHTDVELDSFEIVDTNAFLIKNGMNTFDIPNFGEGAYILSATYRDPESDTEKEVRTGFLVTALSVYMQSSAKDTVVWLNGPDGMSMEGYQVKFTGSVAEGDIIPALPEGVTDGDGLLVIPNSEFEDKEAPKDKESSQEDYYYYSYDMVREPSFSIFDPEGKLVYYDKTDLYLQTGQHEQYYSYLFLDRTIYKPEDTICFWGFAKPYRYNQQEMPETVLVRFDPEGLNLELETELSPDGVFHGEIPLESIRSGQYSIQVELVFPSEQEGEPGTTRIIETEYISVKEFEKPSYVIDTRVDKEYYAPNEEVTLTAFASFYDGTPLPFFPLEMSYYNEQNNQWVKQEVTTDATGMASYTFPAAPENRKTDPRFQMNRCMVQIAADGEHITKMQQYYYFPSDILVEQSISKQADGKNLQLTVRAYELDITSEKLKNYVAENGLDGYDDYYGYGYYDRIGNALLLELAKGKPVDTELDISLRWSYYDSQNIHHHNNQTGGDQYMDYYGYYYWEDAAISDSDMKIIEDWETKEKQITVQTKDGAAVVKDLIHLREGSRINFEKHVGVRAQIEYTDSRGSGFTGTSTYSNDPYYDWYPEMKDETEREIVPGYSLAVTNTATGEDMTPSYNYYYANVAMNAGEQASFGLLLDGEPLDPAGKILYTVIEDGVYDYRIVDGTSFTLPYQMKYGRDVGLVATYFDGARTHYIKPVTLSATQESMQINVEVTPDKSRYVPGDQVRLSIKATDYLGNGVAGNLCVAVVDESIFALSEQSVDVLYGIYNSIQPSTYVSRYCTTYRDSAPEDNPMYDGGKGGGGGAEFYDSYRSNFKDTALFLPTQTDAAGNGYITFTLPDNATSWRITTVAVDGNLHGGESKDNIIASLPFFMKPVITSKYIEGDDIAMLVQGHGTLLDEDSEIHYTVNIKGGGTDITKTVSGAAFQSTEINFGKLPVGSYTVVAKAQYSGYSDTVELPLHVLKSNLELVVNKQINITEQLDISAVRYPVTLTIYDKKNEAFMASIKSLFGHYCMQANQRMSRFVAKRVIRETIADAEVPYYIAKESNDYASDMQNPDGGIAPYPGAGSDLETSTYVLLVAKDQFDLEALSEYYRDQLKKTTDPELRAFCYLGLSATGDATKEELLKALGNKKLDLVAQAYYVAGLAYIGETEKASELYEELFSKHMKGLDTEKQDDEWDRVSAAIWIAASKLGHEDADTLSIYFGGPNWRYGTLFECMIYVTNYDRPVEATSFSYTLNGVQHQETLGFTGMKTLVLSKSDLESLRFTNYSDGLKAVAYYVGEPEEIGIEQSENMSIRKTVRPLDDKTHEVTLTIRLKEDAPIGQYDISDWVPSNTRLYSLDESYALGKDYYVNFDTTVEGQKLYITFTHGIKQNRVIRYTYRVRQTYDGEAMLDTTYMIHGNSGENCQTEKTPFDPNAETVTKASAADSSGAALYGPPIPDWMKNDG